MAPGMLKNHLFVEEMGYFRERGGVGLGRESLERSWGRLGSIWSTRALLERECMLRK